MAAALDAALARSALLRLAVRWRWAVLTVAAVAVALLEVHTSGPSDDGAYFSLAGRQLLSSTGLHVYAAKGLQAGPLQVGGFGLLSVVTGWLHLPDDPTYAVLSTVGSVALVVTGGRVLRRRLGLPPSGAVELLVGGLALGWLVATEVYLSGHPAELVIPVLWMLAASLALDGRTQLAAVLIGAGAGFETWSLLGVPVLLLADSRQGALRGLPTAAVVAAALYLPFVIAGPFRMGQAVWPVAHGSLIHALAPHLTTFPWSARLLQSLVVMAFGAAAALSLSRSARDPRVAIWLVPGIVALSKAISEPSGYDWYWLPVEITLLAACATADALRLRSAVAVVGLELVAITTSLHAWPVGLAALAVLAAIVVGEVRPGGVATHHETPARSDQRVGQPA